MHRSGLVLAIGLAACGGAAARTGRTTALRPACEAGQYWDGKACAARGGESDLAAADKAIEQAQYENAVAALDRAAERPLDHASYLLLWARRGEARASAEEFDEARAAFTHVLEADPGYAIDCDLGAPIFRPFQEARAAAIAAGRAAPELELRWRRDLRLGEPVPIEVETIADPSSMMHTVTVYVRPRGEEQWRAADLGLAPPGKVERLVLPAFGGSRATALELFAVASDARGNEVHLWASPDHPRELPLRYDPPTRWYRKWWVWAAAGGVVAVGTGIGVYAAVWEPSDNLDATVSGVR